MTLKCRYQTFATVLLECQLLLLLLLLYVFPLHFKTDNEKSLNV